AGATDRHLDVSEAFASHAGFYSLTVWNDSGVATSAVQTVTVRTTPRQAGSIDPGFAAQVPANPGALRVLTVLANGNYAAAFAKVPGQVPGRVVQFHKDGTVESQVQLNLGVDELDWPEVVSILADGKLVLVGTQLFRATGEGTLEVTYDTAGL